MYKRILLKLSGEALSSGNGILDVSILQGIANNIKDLVSHGVQVGVVIGGGNIWRGKIANDIGMERVPADYMGMLGTVINAIAVSQTLNRLNVKSKVFSAVHEIEGVCDLYSPKAANVAFDEGNVVFFAGGIGKPYFSTDTAAAQRAVDTHCDAILMAKHGVDGVYDSDPRLNKNAKFFKVISYKDMLDKKLGVMDLPAVEIIKDTDLQIRVFSMSDPNNIIKVCLGEDIGTTVKKGN